MLLNYFVYKNVGVYVNDTLLNYLVNDRLTSLSYFALTCLDLAHCPVLLCLNDIRSSALVLSNCSSFSRAASGLVFCNSSNSFN